MRPILAALIMLACTPIPAAAADYLVWVRFENAACITSERGCFHSAAQRKRHRYSTVPEAPTLRITPGGRGWIRRGSADDGFVVVRPQGVRIGAGVQLRDDEELIEVAIDSAENGRAVVDVSARTPNLAAASRITARLGTWEPAVTLADGRSLLVRVERAP